jgi:hypothetical protein
MQSSSMLKQAVHVVISGLWFNSCFSLVWIFADRPLSCLNKCDLADVAFKTGYNHRTQHVPRYPKSGRREVGLSVSLFNDIVRLYANHSGRAA